MSGYVARVGSPWGTITLLWKAVKDGGWKIQRVILPHYTVPALPAAPDTGGIIHGRELIDCLVQGYPCAIDYGILDLTLVTDKHRQVLIACSRVPRGYVTSYRDLAVAAGMPRSPRAIGTYMAHNPFPLLIPCHRVLRTDGTLGGYGGGLTMKRELLEKEGIRFERDGKVNPSSFVAPLC